MVEVIAHIVATKGEHGHGIAAHESHGSRGGGGHLASHGCPEVDAMNPVKALEDKGHSGGATASENDRADRDALGVVGFGSERGIILHGRSEPGVWVGGFFS